MIVSVQNTCIWLGPHAPWYTNKDKSRPKLLSHKSTLSPNTYMIRKNEYIDRDVNARHIPERVYSAIIGKTVRPMNHLFYPYSEFDTFNEYDDYIYSNPHDYLAELWYPMYNTNELIYCDNMNDDELAEVNHIDHNLESLTDEDIESNEEYHSDEEENDSSTAI